MTADGELRVLTELDPGRAALPAPPPHRRHRRCCPASWGSRASPRPPTCWPPAGTSPPSRTSSCSRRSSSTATSRARSSCVPACATAATARSSPTAGSSGRRTLAGRRRAGDAALHRPRPARARGARRRRPAAAPGEAGEGVDHDAVYKVYFHGPAYQVLERAWRDDGHTVGMLAPDLPADHDPGERDTEFVPRLIELCFQTAGVLELGTAGRMALPAARRPRRSATPAPTSRAGCSPIVSRRDDGDGVDAEVVDDDRARARPARGLPHDRAAGRRRRGRAGADPRGHGSELTGVVQRPVHPPRHRQPGRARDAGDPRRPRAQRWSRRSRSA